MILVISGTNRPGCNSLNVANILVEKYKKNGIPVELMNLQDLPAELFSPNSYAEKPAEFEPFQKLVIESHGIHLVIPEYNGSFPGVLKYFIDMLKFPESFDDLSVAYTGISAGVWGGIRACEQLQMVFAYRNGFAFPNRVFIPGIHNLLDEAGNLTDVGIDQRLEKQVKGFNCFVKATYPDLRGKDD